MTKTQLCIAFLAILILTTIPTVQVEATQPANLVARWHFDEGAGKIAYDSSGNANHGTLSGGRFGGALSFDGTNDYVISPDTANLRLPTTELTIEVWIYFDSSGTGIQLEVRKWIDSDGGYSSYVLGKTADDKIYGSVQSKTPSQYPSWVTSSTINALGISNAWAHVAFVWKKGAPVGVSDGKIYVNGVLVPVTYAANGYTDSFAIQYTAYPLYFANRVTAWPSSYFKGYMDEIRISNVARTSFGLTAAPTVDANTAALWHFDEGSGQTAGDAAGFSPGQLGSTSGVDDNDPKWLKAGPTWATGRFGQGLSFDGSDDYVQIRDSASLDSLAEFSVELWVKPSIKYEAGAHDFFVFVSKFGPGSFQFVYHPDGYLYLWVGTASWGMAAKSLGRTLDAGTWYHLAATFKTGTSESHIYLDGIDITDTTTVQTMTSNDSPLMIGARPSPTPTYPLHYVHGILDEVRIWSRILSTEEVKMHAWGLVGEWDFNEGTGTTAYDSSGFGNDGTLQNGTPWTLEGRFSKALDLNGVNQFVSVPDSSSLDVSGELTIEAWIYPHVTNTYKSIVVKGDAYTEGKINYGLQLIGTEGFPPGTLRFFRFAGPPGSTGPYTFVESTSQVAINSWHHVAVTVQGTTVNFYIDGAPAGTKTLGLGPFSDSPLDIAMHDHATLGAGQYFDGRIDDVRIWGKALVPVTFKQTGLDNTATGTVVTVTDPIPLTYAQLPHVVMVKSGCKITYDYEASVASSSPGQNFKLLSVTPPEPSTPVSGPTTVTGAYQLNHAPTADAGGPYNSPEGTPILVSASGSSDPDGDSLNYRWDINNDGNWDTDWSTDPSPGSLVVYDDYSGHIKVQVSDGYLMDNDEADLTFYNVAPVVDAGSNVVIDEGDTFTGSGSFVDPGWDSWTATVDYGDGSGVQDLALSGKTFSLSHVYADDDDDDIYTVTVTVTDDNGGSHSDTLTVGVNNVAPAVTGPADTGGDEGSLISIGQVIFTDPGDDTFTATINWGDGSSVVDLGAVTSPITGLSHTYADNGVYTVTVTVTDDDTGSDTDSITVTVNNVAPTITGITGPLGPVQKNAETSIAVTFTDPGTLDTHTATVDWGDETVPTSGPYESGDPLKHTYTTASVYSVTVTITDKDGGSDTETYEFIVVTEPGFITGGGWITSPAGAYKPNLTLTGKATFGFVSKYEKGATTPTGTTTFVFHVGEMRFESTSYDWLVVAGPTAQFKGTGMINDLGEYKFMLWAGDGGKTNPDTFRIKIWQEDGAVEDVYYDNGVQQTIAGGSIVVHK